MFVLLAIGTVLGVAYCAILLLTGKKYDYMVEPLDSKEYFLPEIYTFGFFVMNLTKHNFTTKQEEQRRKNITVLKGAKYAEYYLQVDYARRISLSAPLLILAFFLPAMGDEILMFPIMLALAVLVEIYFSRDAQKKITERSEELIREFPDVVSKLALLINAGMILRRAWEKVAFSSDGIIYEEMKNVCRDLNDGVSEQDAYRRFGDRCVLPEIKKFASTIVIGILRGNKELTYMLKEQSGEVWQLKINNAKRQGEAAVSKLIVPMMMIFFGVMIMIVVPIFSNLGI